MKGSKRAREAAASGIYRKIARGNVYCTNYISNYQLGYQQLT